MSLGVTGAAIGFSAATRGGRRRHRRPGSAGCCPARRRSGVRSAGSRSSADSPRRRAPERTRCWAASSGRRSRSRRRSTCRRPSAEVSGSFESLVPFPTLSRQGRRFVWNLAATRRHRGGDGRARGRRRRSAPTSASRARRPRTSGSRSRWPSSSAPARSNASWLMFTSPTGTGYVNYAAVGALECLTRGDCATVAMQYSARPSVLSLDRVDEGQLHATKLHRARSASGSPRSPPTAVRSSSCSARASARGRARTRSRAAGPQGPIADGVDHAIWIGTPYLSKWKEQVLHDDGPDIDRGSSGCSTTSTSGTRSPTRARGRSAT